VVMNQGKWFGRFPNCWGHKLAGLNNADIQASFRYSQVFNEL
jgi:hypothetical protein